MKRPRLFLFDPNLISMKGHYLGYALRIARAAADFGVETILVANAAAKLDTGVFEIMPALRLDYWQEMCPSGDPHDHLARTAGIFAQTVEEIVRERSIENGDVLFFPYANLAETMGLGRFSLKWSGGSFRSVLLFRREMQEQGIDSGLGVRLGTGIMRQALAELYASQLSGQVRLLTDSDGLTEEYAESTRRRYQTAPIPVDPEISASKIKINGMPPTNIVYLGDARTEKGYQHLPAVAEELRMELISGSVRMILQSNFNLPGGEPGIHDAYCILAKYPNVVLLNDPMEDESYLKWMRSADLILLPYQADRYIFRTSGILAEAIHAGVPVIVPRGTWLSEQIVRHGAGVMYGAPIPQDLCAAVRLALENLPQLRARAAERRESFIQFHNPRRLVQFICGSEILDKGEQFKREMAL
jgi:glycosyltransferase involved in cell wall biosynthesis